MEGKYKRLVSNTTLFAISQFSSRLLFFIMAPLFSYWFETQEIAGVKDLLNQFANFCIPIVSLGISNAVIRFGLEEGVNKKKVYSNGYLAIGMGFVLLLLVSPLLAKIEWYSDYIVYLCIYVLVSCIRTLNCQFVRARQLNRLYAIDGILCTVVTCLFYVLFIRTLQLGPLGYLISVILGDGFSAIFLFISAKLWRFLRFRGCLPLLKKMLRFSLPLVPASIFWWVTSSSDQLFVAAMLPNGEAMTAQLGASYKLPTVLSIIGTIFTEAWQISAFTDGAGEGKEHFFSRVFGTYQSVLFVVSSGVLLMARPFMSVFREDYYTAWRFIPFLTLAMLFSGLSNFLNSIYMREKKNGMALVTMAVGAVLNCILNLWWIGMWGVMGAVLASFTCYFVVFLLRAFNTRTMLRMEFGALRMAVNLSLLILQTLIMLFSLPLWWLWSILICAALCALNFHEMWNMAMQLLKKKKRT